MAAAATAALRPARIGGNVAAAGDYSVEVGLHEGGRIEALVSDAKGQLVTENIKLVATAQAKGGASEKVELAFVPARGRFEGRAKAGVELAPGPVDVALDVGGKAHGCKLHAAAVAPEPKLGGNVLDQHMSPPNFMNGVSGSFPRSFLGFDVPNYLAALQDPGA